MTGFKLGLQGMLTAGFMNASAEIIDCEPIDFDKLPGNIQTTIETAENKNELPNSNQMIQDTDGNTYKYNDEGGTGDWMIEGPAVKGCVFTRTFGRG